MANPVRVQAEVVEVKRYVDGIVGYGFRPLSRVPRFAPGQFLHLTVDHFDHASQWPESRVFSIASSPVEREIIRVIISQKGVYTRKIIENLTVGSIVWLKMPYGEFTFDLSAPSLVLIGGGTGMAPFISFLEECLVEKPTADIWVYYGVRKYEHLVYQDFLNACAEVLPNIKVRIFVEQADADTAVVRSGILNIGLVLKETQQLNADYYLSGPWVMIDKFRGQLLEQGIQTHKIKIDEWS
ncbi:MAG: FAD-dependent oxidoreductase [Chitinophagaceae bacterium]|nr:FAD-dependent oxidoreductase [Chitinophagaceae bacterium]